MLSQHGLHQLLLVGHHVRVALYAIQSFLGSLQRGFARGEKVTEAEMRDPFLSCLSSQLTKPQGLAPSSEYGAAIRGSVPSQQLWVLKIAIDEHPVAGYVPDTFTLRQLPQQLGQAQPRQSVATAHLRKGCYAQKRLKLKIACAAISSEFVVVEMQLSGPGASRFQMRDKKLEQLIPKATVQDGFDSLHSKIFADVSRNRCVPHADEIFPWPCGF